MGGEGVPKGGTVWGSCLLTGNGLRQVGCAPSQPCCGAALHKLPFGSLSFLLTAPNAVQSSLELRGGSPCSPTSPPRPALTRGCSAPAVLPLPAGTLRVDSSWKTSVSPDLQDRPKKDQLWGTVAAQYVALVEAACKYRFWLPFCSSVEEQEFFLKQRHKI